MLRKALLALALACSLGPAFAQAPPPVPALPDTERRTQYSISASTGPLAVGFQIYADDGDPANWIQVYLNGVLTNAWTLSSPSGSLSTLARPITDAQITFGTPQTGTVQIVGARRPRRLNEFAENRGVPARDHNQILNDIEAQLREAWDLRARTMGIAEAGFAWNPLPVAALRAGLFLCFDSNGQLTTCTSVTGSAFAAGSGISFSGSPTTTIALKPADFTGLGIATFVTPEQFGAKCNGDGFGGGTDDSTAFQAAVNAAGANPETPGTLLLSNCVYLIKTPITDTAGIYVRGKGKHASIIDFEPQSSSLALYTVHATGGNTASGGLTDFAITSHDTTTAKSALVLVDISSHRYAISNLIIRGDSSTGHGTTVWGNGGQSLGIVIQGARDGVDMTSVDIAADTPIRIDYNPNANPIDLDISSFRGLSLVAFGNPCIFFRPGVVINRLAIRDIWCGLGAEVVRWAAADGNTTATNGNYASGTTSFTVASAAELAPGHPILLTLDNGALAAATVVTSDFVHAVTITCGSPPCIPVGRTLNTGGVVLPDGGIADAVTFDHITSEQGLTPGAYNIYWAPNSPFYGLRIMNSSLDGNRNCYFLRHVVHALIENTVCFAGGAGTTGTIHLNADATNGNIDFINVRAFAADTLSGLTTLSSVPTGFPSDFSSSTVGANSYSLSNATIAVPSFAVGVLTTPSLVGGLPTCVSGLQGVRRFVTDATSTTFHATAAGLGSNKVAVVCDGTNWYVD